MARCVMAVVAAGRAMLLTRRNPDHVTGPISRSALPSAARGPSQPSRSAFCRAGCVCPCRPGARLERHAGHRTPCRIGGLEQRVDTHRAV